MSCLSATNLLAKPWHACPRAVGACAPWLPLPVAQVACSGCWLPRSHWGKTDSPGACGDGPHPSTHCRFCVLQEMANSVYLVMEVSPCRPDQKDPCHWGWGRPHCLGHVPWAPQWPWLVPEGWKVPLSPLPAWDAGDACPGEGRGHWEPGMGWGDLGSPLTDQACCWSLTVL